MRLGDLEDMVKQGKFTAIATEYDGIVFRSRTEAYLYEYFKLTYPGAIILYESKHYATDEYTPDLIIGSDKLHMAIEIKPRMEFAEPIKYGAWLMTFSCMDDFIVATPRETKSFIDKRSITVPINEQRYKQAYNNVMREINPRGYLRKV